ncbi:hypothetical protein LINPERHAP1_LOCUS32828 [Linum perenne]
MFTVNVGNLSFQGEFLMKWWTRMRFLGMLSLQVLLILVIVIMHWRCLYQ